MNSIRQRTNKSNWQSRLFWPITRLNKEFSIKVARITKVIILGGKRSKKLC